MLAGHYNAQELVLQPDFAFQNFHELSLDLIRKRKFELVAALEHEGYAERAA